MRILDLQTYIVQKNDGRTLYTCGAIDLDCISTIYGYSESPTICMKDGHVVKTFDYLAEDIIKLWKGDATIEQVEKFKKPMGGK